jgi:hypothetical protein
MEIPVQGIRHLGALVGRIGETETILLAFFTGSTRHWAFGETRRRTLKRAARMDKHGGHIHTICSLEMGTLQRLCTPGMLRDPLLIPLYRTKYFHWRGSEGEEREG